MFFNFLLLLLKGKHFKSPAVSGNPISSEDREVAYSHRELLLSLRRSRMTGIFLFHLSNDTLISQLYNPPPNLFRYRKPQAYPCAGQDSSALSHFSTYPYLTNLILRGVSTQHISYKFIKFTQTKKFVA
jgi:hypothetical protein